MHVANRLFAKFVLITHLLTGEHMENEHFQARIADTGRRTSQGTPEMHATYLLSYNPGEIDGSSVFPVFFQVDPHTVLGFTIVHSKCLNID